jgi:DNA repair exonuclease SbcCD ATPase subunit
MLKIFYTILLLITTATCIAQEQEKSIFDLPEKAIASLTNKYQHLDKQIEQATENYIAKLEKQEAKLHKKLHTKDSTKAKAQLAGMQQHYQKLRARMQRATTNPQLANEYFAQVDSVATTAKYLLVSNPNNASLKTLNQSIATMQSKLQASVDIKKMMKARKDELRNQLKDLGVTKQPTTQYLRPPPT